MAARKKTDIFEELRKPFPPEVVKWRAGATTRDGKRCLALAYIDARDVMDRLDELMGPEGWQTRLERAEGGYVCHLGLLTLSDKAWVWKSDAAGDTGIEGAKGGASDALKRAAVQWGVGRYLYGTESPWVDYDSQRKRITDAGLVQCRKVLAGGEVGDAPEDQPHERAFGEGPPDAKAEDESREEIMSRRISPDQKKALMAINFKSLEYLGFDRDEIYAMTPAQKFEPINYATKALGHERTDEITRGQVEAAKQAMRDWCKEHKNKKATADE